MVRGRPVRFVMRRACLASFLLLVAAPALAQPVTPIPPRHRAPRNVTPKPKPTPAAQHGDTFLPAPDVQPTTTHKEGDYGGVSPGEAPPVDHPRPKRKPPVGTLSWVGFEAKSGGAELFFQSIAPFEVTQTVAGGSVVAHLGNLRTLGANAWRAVDTRYFDNPLSRIEARRATHGAGLDVRVTFKTAKDAHEGTLKSGLEADGYYYVYLTFPAGTDQKPATTAEPEK